ncbi:MAG: alpha-L-arabinofuranosidase, partial [Planctomycetota bacterium]
AMKEVDPTILVGPNGPNDPEDRGAADKKAGREVSWWKAVLGIASADIDFLALHDYPCWKWRRYEAYIDKEPTFGGAAGGGVATLTRYCAAEDAERIRVAMTEVNSADWSASFEDKKGWPHVNTLGHGVVLFDIIGSYLLHPKVDLLCVWNTRWTENDIAQELWDALSPQNELWPTGRAIAIWGQFVRDNMVFAEAGSGMRAFASHAPSSGELSVFLVNKGLEAQPATVTLNGYAPGSPAERWVFTGSEPEDLNPTWSREEDVEVQGESFSVDLPPVCVTVVALKSGESAD